MIEVKNYENSYNDKGESQSYDDSNLCIAIIGCLYCSMGIRRSVKMALLGCSCHLYIQPSLDDEKYAPQKRRKGT